MLEKSRKVLEMYFKLILDSGHVGAGKSLETVRYFKGKNPVDLFSLVSRMPRVKGKHTGSGIKLVQSIGRDEYLRGIKQTSEDRYLNTRKSRKGSGRKKEVLYH